MNQTNYNFKTTYTVINENKLYVDHINSRVKIIELNNVSVDSITKIINFSIEEKLGKIIYNCNYKYLKTLLEVGFQIEGIIDGYFKGTDGFCMSYFIDENRRILTDNLLKNSFLKQNLSTVPTDGYNPNCSYIIRTATEGDVKEMTKLFSKVFTSYPTPVYDEDYLKNTMQEKVLYKIAIDNEKIISIASADMDMDNLNAEITDCATNENYRGKGTLSALVHSLELELKGRGLMTLYSLCRSINPGINFVLKKHNYSFRGRLLNNCNICGDFEDMNVWVKSIYNN